MDKGVGQHFEIRLAGIRLPDPVARALLIRNPVEGRLIEPAGLPGIVAKIESQRAVVELQPLDREQRIDAGPEATTGIQPRASSSSTGAWVFLSSASPG
jgi:hypothetical protein